MKLILSNVPFNYPFLFEILQRYGWHGLDDPDLQQNIANAAEKYSWIEEYKDKSVTELEFMHGHLNNPGQMPAIIAFRDTVRIRRRRNVDYFFQI